MATIINLTQGQFTAGSSIPFYDQINGSDRRGSVASLAAVMQGMVNASSALAQYAAPSESGFIVSINPASPGRSTWLLLTPAAGYSMGTILLPQAITCVDGQEVSVSSTQFISNLTVNGNGASVSGAPVTMAAGGSFKLRFDGVFGGWFGQSASTAIGAAATLTDVQVAAIQALVTGSGISGATYDGSARLVSYSINGVAHTVAYPTSTSAVISNALGASRAVTFDSLGRVSAVI